MKSCPQCDTGYPDRHTTCPTHGVPLNEIRDLKPGMVVHHSYRIVRKLGQGGMGAVYLAQHTLMDEPRALKFLSAELSGDQAFTSRFLREVRVLRQIRNRNVVDFWAASVHLQTHPSILADALHGPEFTVGQLRVGRGRA